MIHLVTAENAHLYRREMHDYFRLRYDIYVIERGWHSLPIAEPEIERDQFDTSDTIYLLAIENDRVVGGSRLFPTIKPHLLSEVFPHLADVRGVPNGPDIVEWTRMFVVKSLRDSWRNGGVAGQLVCGGLEYCVQNNITAFTFLFEAFRLPRLHEFGWQIEPLGLPAIVENGWWIAALVHIDEQMFRRTRFFCGIQGETLLQRGIVRAPASHVA